MVIHAGSEWMNDEYKYWVIRLWETREWDLSSDCKKDCRGLCWFVMNESMVVNEKQILWIQSSYKNKYINDIV